MNYSTVEPEKLKVNELVSILSEYGVKMPGARQKKEYYVQLFKKSISENAENIHRSAQNIKPRTDDILLVSRKMGSRLPIASNISNMTPTREQLLERSGNSKKLKNHFEQVALEEARALAKERQEHILANPYDTESENDELSVAEEKYTSSEKQITNDVFDEEISENLEYEASIVDALDQSITTQPEILTQDEASETNTLIKLPITPKTNVDGFGKVTEFLTIAMFIYTLFKYTGYEIKDSVLRF